MNHSYDVVIIGGGASGYFCSLLLKEKNPKLKVVILEKTSKVLSKVKVSGGGRCNVTHEPLAHKKFSKNYPRGQQFLNKAFQQFGAQDMIAWLQQKGVQLNQETDGRIFPSSNNSQTIIDCFLELAYQYQIPTQFNYGVDDVQYHNKLYTLRSKNNADTYTCQHLIVSIGGHYNAQHYSFIKNIHTSLTPIHPSLFSFNVQQKKITELLGISVQHACVKVVNQNLSSEGPLLITHWGLSGPCILKLSAYGALDLAQIQYAFKLHIKWHEAFQATTILSWLEEQKIKHPHKKISNTLLEPMPTRLWEFLLSESDITLDQTWNSISKKQMNKVVECCVNYEVNVTGKTTYKEEFVTAGGIALDSIDALTLESNVSPRLYFTGEVLNIDGITGGFNFQAAWTTAYLVAKAIAG
jgi:predicted Rossmann fold flavoprotein